MSGRSTKPLSTHVIKMYHLHIGLEINVLQTGTQCCKCKHTV
jgi:hypothetical protein